MAIEPAECARCGNVVVPSDPTCGWCGLITPAERRRAIVSFVVALLMLSALSWAAMHAARPDTPAPAPSPLGAAR